MRFNCVQTQKKNTDKLSKNNMSSCLPIPNTDLKCRLKTAVTVGCCMCIVVFFFKLNNKIVRYCIVLLTVCGTIASVGIGFLKQMSDTISILTLTLIIIIITESRVSFSIIKQTSN